MAGNDAGTLDDTTLERYARQILVQSIGYDGQVRLLRRSVRVGGRGLAADLAARYLGAAGLAVERTPDEPPGVASGTRRWALEAGEDPPAAMRMVGPVVAQVVLTLARQDDASKEMAT